MERAEVSREVRLYVSPRIEGPLACGLFQPEIWLPERALAELTPAQQRAMLAHELAHVVCRDPAWSVVLHLLTCVLFVQPLLRVARRKLEDAAEDLADAWAAEQTGEGVTLAGLLVEVAGWIVAPATPLAAAGMATRRSPLARRIHRLLAAERGTSGPGWLVGLGLILLAGVVAVTAPTVAAVPAERGAEESDEEPAPRTRRLADPRLPGATVPTKATEPAPPTPVSPRGDLESALAELDADLAALAEEVADLEELLNESPGSARRFAPLLSRLSRQVQALAARRDALRAERGRTERGRVLDRSRTPEPAPRTPSDRPRIREVPPPVR
jgi:hypothetical protein